MKRKLGVLALCMALISVLCFAIKISEVKVSSTAETVPGSSTTVGSPWKWDRATLGNFKPALTQRTSTPKTVTKEIRTKSTSVMKQGKSKGTYSVKVTSECTFQGRTEDDDENFHGSGDHEHAVTAIWGRFSTTKPGSWTITGAGECTGKSGGGSTIGGNAGVTVVGTGGQIGGQGGNTYPELPLTPKSNSDSYRFRVLEVNDYPSNLSMCENTDCISYEDIDVNGFPTVWPVPYSTYHRYVERYQGWTPIHKWFCKLYCRNCDQEVTELDEHEVDCDEPGCIGWWWSCDGSHTHTHIFQNSSGSSSGDD